ncbi:MAG: AAA family ATPase [Thermoproteales archaeon]|nr:AAA family ATPase [Thermoproteales archaeon]
MLKRNTRSISSISIRNFRGVRQGHIDGLTDVNIFIGKNGSGKSTILEAVYMASSWIEPSDRIRIKYKLDYLTSRRTGRGEWASSRNIFWFSMDTEKDIEVSLSFKDSRKAVFKVFHEISGNINEGVWLKVPDKLTKELSDYYCYTTNRGFSKAEKVFRGGISPDMRGKILDILPGLNVLKNVVLVDERLLTTPSLVEQNVWPRLLAQRLDKVVVDVVRKGYEPDAEGLTYMPIAGGYSLALQLSKTTVQVDALGDGARSAILLSSVLATMEKGVALIEDPENSQHPGGLVVLMDFALNVAKRKGIQVFVTTHSLELVRILGRLCSELGLGVKVFFLERSNEGVLDVRVLERADTDLLLKLGLDPRFLHVI